METSSGFELRPHDQRLVRALRALPDPALDRGRAHIAAGLPLRRADLGWHLTRPAEDGCLLGVSMSRFQFLGVPLRLPGLVLLAAAFDAWSFEECLRLGELDWLRGRRIPPAVATRLAQLLDLELRRRSGWPPVREGARTQPRASATAGAAPADKIGG